MEEIIARKKSNAVSNTNPMTAVQVRDTQLTLSQSGLELLARMTPLEGCVTWSTWGSKLESIFAPIFASLPTLQGSQIYTLRDTPVEICLANGLSKSGLQKSRDVLTYCVVARPQHGILSEYTTTSDYITYSPNEGKSPVLLESLHFDHII